MSTKKNEKTTTVPLEETPPSNVATQVAEGINFEADAGAGFEKGKHKLTDFKIPFLTIIQSGSPQVKEGEPQYREDAKPGMVVNTVTNEIIDARKSKGGCILVVALDRVTEYPEWKPQRGGLVKVHLNEDILKQTKKGTGNDETKDILPNGNIIDTTAKWFVMQLTKDGYLPGIMAMSRSNLKHSRAWLTKIGACRGKRADGTVFPMPFFAYHWKLSTVPETGGPNNDTYFAWDTEQGELVKSTNDYLELKSTREAVTSGQLALPDSASNPELTQGNNTPY